MFWFEVVYKRDDNTVGSVAGGNGSVEDANQQCVYHIGYYRNLGYTITEATVNRFCDHCQGSGKVYKALRRGGLKIAQECKACKGKAILESFKIEF